MTTQQYIKALETKNKELREALQALHDEQNGPPLIRLGKGWGKAMAEAERLLAIEPDEKPKRYGCHCELEPGQSPDECVLTSHPDDCVHAIQLALSHKPREDCPYWREIKEEG